MSTECTHTTLRIKGTTMGNPCVDCGTIVLDFDVYYRDNGDGTKTEVGIWIEAEDDSHPEFDDGYEPMLLVFD